MSVLVVGTTALDSIKTPSAENPRLLGGSASHAAIAASFFAPTKLLGVVGGDFPAKYLKLYQKHGIELAGLERVKAGQTFHWSGEYEVNMNNRRTLDTVLGVIEHWSPKLPGDYKAAPYVLLANIAPPIQHAVIDQLSRPKFIVADTMDLWMNIMLPDLLRLLKRVDAFVLNEGEAHQLTQEDNVFSALKKIHKLGPKYVIIKKGEHGALLYSHEGVFIYPAYPLESVCDPTGAGDSFAGGVMGYLAAARKVNLKTLKTAIGYGTIVASFTVEKFGLERLREVKREHFDKRLEVLKKICKI